jgi:hypothetical protein
MVVAVDGEGLAAFGRGLPQGVNPATKHNAAIDNFIDTAQQIIKS